MGKAYSGVDDQAMVATPGDSVLSYQATVAIRPAFFEIIVGTTGSPDDKSIEYRLKRFDTADGTGDGLTGDPLDPGDPAALGTLQGNHSAEPTYGSLGQPLIFGLNQRATFRWIAAPGREIKSPAVATEGLGLVGFNASYVGLYTGTIFWEE